MPLVERYNDWNITDGSFDDPHTLEFDHRIEADVVNTSTGLVNVENNVKAACIITVLTPEFGWTQVGNKWIYDPIHKETDLYSTWRNNLSDSVHHDKEFLKNCFCNPTTNPTTAYVGPEAEALTAKIESLEWPRDTTGFLSRFALAGQYMVGPLFCSAYHLGHGYVGTAGHCLENAILDGRLCELRVVFNYVGNVARKKTFTESEVFKIEKVVICDTNGPASSTSDTLGVDRWLRRWDSAILKLVGTPEHFSRLASANYAPRVPELGSPVYNIGCPLGTQLKVSGYAHILRYSLTGEDEKPFSHLLPGYGAFSTDLDQFKGNSGGPVFDAKSGLIVGHTSITQDAVAEGDAAAIKSWADEYAKGSSNYVLTAEINCLLQKQIPNNMFYRIHPKFLRTLLGKTGVSPLITCATNICPGDLGPNKAMQEPGRHQAVFSRHHFDTKDVYTRNITARVDRSALFMTPLNVLLNEHDACTLTVKLAGRNEVFRKPDASSTLSIAISPADLIFEHLDFRKDTTSRARCGLDVYSTTIDLTARRATIPKICLDAPKGLLQWTTVRLEQPLRNPPLIVGLNVSVRRPSFPFPVNKAWPPERPDVTDRPEDADLRWPEETFEFATTAGDTMAASQTDGVSKRFEEVDSGEGLWAWDAPLNRVWTNPKQPSHGLRDPLMDDVDELLA